jgi:aspartate/methionine/tyrosine aminotransferase
MKITTTGIQDPKQADVRRLQALAAQNPGVINLSGDHPNLETPDVIRETFKKALDNSYASNLPARGCMDLREVIAVKLKAENNIDAQPDTEILVATETMPIVFSICQYLIETSDEVIMVDPGFNYGTHIQHFGGIPIRVPAYEANGFKVDPEDIRASVTDKTKLIILNTPANPTGAVLDKTVLKKIAEIACENNLWVLSDESYEHIIYDGNKHISIGSIDSMKDRTISIYSFSTSYAMTGWEVAYVVAPKAVIDKLEELGEYIGSRVSAVAQRVALTAIKTHRRFFHKMMRECEERRAIIHRGLNAIVDVSCRLPASTFYAFPNFTKLGLTSWNLAKYLVREHKVALLPGSIFGSKGEGFLRLSFATDPAKLKEAISCIKQGVGQLFSR